MLLKNKDHHILAQKAIKIIKEAIAQLNKDKITLAIPGGRSVKEIFKLFRTADLPWHKIHIFWVDDRMVDHASPDSNYKLAKESFLDELILFERLPQDNIHPFNLDIESYNEEYTGVDIIILGVGEDGHVGALYPNHYSIMNNEEAFFTMTDSPKPPPERMTSSRTMLEKAHTAIALFLGEAKQQALNNYLDESVSVEQCPAKLINKVKNHFVLTDIA